MNGTGVRLAKETPRVWLLAPKYPKSTEEELSHLEEQWKEQHPWWLQWLWWWFCWRHSLHFKRLPNHAIDPDISISELNRILGGDASCSLYTLQSESLSQTVRQLAPKSVIYLFPIGLFPSRWEETLLNRLKKTLTEGGHSVHLIDRPSPTDTWLEVVGQWIRYNIITHSKDHPVKHIVLLMRRQVEHWNGFDSTSDKQRYLLEQAFSGLFPTCTIHVLLNAPHSKSILKAFPDTEHIYYGFIDSLNEDRDALHPALTQSNLSPLKPNPESILLLRLLRQHIWESTGCAP